jgi:hypothetical protein
MPLMCGWFTTPLNSFRSHTIALVRGAAEGWVVGRREAVRSTVSGKFLAKALVVLCAVADSVLEC